MPQTLILLLISFILLHAPLPGIAARRQIPITPNNITTSGISSGAYMAIQMHMAFSKIISGSASISGGVYWCSEGNLVTAQMDCMKYPKTESPETPLMKMRTYENEGLIDSISNLKNHRSFIFSSYADTVVNSKNSLRLENFLKSLMPATNVTHLKMQDVAHGMPTLNFGNPCSQGRSPWLLNCNLDLAGEIFKNLYKRLKPRGRFIPENLSSFSQKEFDTKGEGLLHARGWIYVPSSCRAGETCRLHIAFHGCQMSPEFIEDTYVKNAGYNEWAESNHIVVLYPQTSKSLINPQACWDWFGLTGPMYATKAGPQMQALFNLIRTLAPATSHL